MSTFQISLIIHRSNRPLIQKFRFNKITKIDLMQNLGLWQQILNFQTLNVKSNLPMIHGMVTKSLIVGRTGSIANIAKNQNKIFVMTFLVNEICRFVIKSHRTSLALKANQIQIVFFVHVIGHFFMNQKHFGAVLAFVRFIRNFGFVITQHMLLE